MKNVNLIVNNHMGRHKGDFFVSDTGVMSPKTRNRAIWGAVHIKDILQTSFLFDENFMFGFGSHRLEGDVPVRLSAFFKFQKSNFNVFAESTGMELAYYFNTKTSYNCPAKLDLNEKSIKDALNTISPENSDTYGTLVFSMLEKDEKLYSFSRIQQQEEPTSDIRANLKSIRDFVQEKMPCQSQNYESLIEKMERNLCYQYLFRDCFGDVDYTSKNSGIIFNENTKEMRLAANFDFGEMLSILYNTKLVKPKLLDTNILSEAEKAIPGFVESIEKSNQAKLEKYNIPAYELGKNMQTFGDETIKNVDYICSTHPEVAIVFLNSLQEFKQSGILPVLISETSRNEQAVESCGKIAPLISEDEQNMVVEYLNGKLETYEETLTSSLQKNLGEETLNNILLQKSTSDEITQEE